MSSEAGFAKQYGPWALVVGASEGIGSTLAEVLAERGLNVVLLARRAPVLAEVAAGIEARHGVRTRSLAIDLAADDAAEQVLAAVADLEIGFLAYCAGADPLCANFLDQDLATAEAMIHRNVTVTVQLIHRLGSAMRDRGRGAIVTFSSGAGLIGGAGMAAYGGSKAFDLVFTDALWAELEPHGVDVLGVVLGETDTPALRRLKHGDAERPVRGATSVQSVVTSTLARLGKGPTLMLGQARFGAKVLPLLPRRSAVVMMSKAAAKAVGR